MFEFTSSTILRDDVCIWVLCSVNPGVCFQCIRADWPVKHPFFVKLLGSWGPRLQLKSEVWAEILSFQKEKIVHRASLDQSYSKLMFFHFFQQWTIDDFFTSLISLFYGFHSFHVATLLFFPRGVQQATAVCFLWPSIMELKNIE